MLGVCKQQDILIPQAVYGFWPANAEGNDVILYDPETQEREVARFTLPRQARAGGLCIADFLRDVSSGQRDVLGLQIVTMEIGRAHVWTPVTNAHLVCRLLLGK